MMVAGYSGFLITNEPVYKMVVLLSVPIFSYLFVEGFDNTKNRKKYIFRLWITALGIQILYTIAMDTYSLNGIFGIIASYFLIERFEQGEWYWLHTFVMVMLFAPIEYGVVTVILSTLYYVIKHKEKYKNKFILFYLILCAVSPIWVISPIFYLVDVAIISIMNSFLKRRETASKSIEKHYALLIVSYVVVVVVRFVLLSYK